MATMYERIETLCKQRETNVTAMCRALGISRSALSELKTGRTKSLSYETLSAIAEHFGASVEELGGKPAPQPHSPTLTEEEAELQEYLEELRNNPQKRMFFSLTKDATKEDVEKAVKIIEALLGKNQG